MSTVPFDPMDGCPQCKWAESNLGRHLEQTCSLHQRIEDMQFDMMMDRRIAKELGAMLGDVVRALGGEDDDDPIELAKMRMEEIAELEDECAKNETELPF